MYVVIAQPIHGHPFYARSKQRAGLTLHFTDRLEAEAHADLWYRGRVDYRGATVVEDATVARRHAALAGLTIAIAAEHLSPEHRRAATIALISDLAEAGR